MKITKLLMTTCAVGVASLFVFVSLTNAAGIGDRLRGRILLQVESHGEAWYINPDTGRRHYMGGATDAYQLMRRLGLGISNADFDQFGDRAPQRLAGKILLKVEDHGKAFYVNPVDLKLHYLANGADAYQLMRNLGLGVKNVDLGQIVVEDDSGSVASTPTQVTQAPQTSGEDSGSSGSSEADCGSCGEIRTYDCPKLLEYEFTHPDDLSDFIVGFISSGPPLLRLDHAELQGDDMACVYENRFADPAISNDDDEFAFYLWAAGYTCPNYLGLNIRNKDSIAPDWKILYPGYVKIDKTHAGHKYVATFLYSSANESIFTYDGCVYSKNIQEGSDPTLRQVKHGYCVANDTNDGFKCADSLAEMYGTGSSEASPMLAP
jgi:hypothetical protein